MTYGEEVTCYRVDGIKQLRRLGAQAVRLTGRGGRQVLGWATLPAKDPSRHAATTLKRWPAKWWRATDQQLNYADGTSAGDLSKCFHAVQGKLRSGVPSNGPVANAIMWVDKLGWQFVNPGMVQTQDGVLNRTVGDACIAGQALRG